MPAWMELAGQSSDDTCRSRWCWAVCCEVVLGCRSSSVYTCGSDEKRKLLESLGVKFISSSRDADVLETDLKRFSLQKILSLTSCSTACRGGSSSLVCNT